MMFQRLFSFGVLALACPLVHATQGYAVNATVTGVDVRVGGVFMIAVSPAPVSQPACATASDHRMTGNSTTADGKALLSASLTAYATGSPIALIQGTGTCNEYGTYESISILSQGKE